MRLYLDDNIASKLLTRSLRKAGEDVQIPTDVGMAGRSDPAHLAHSIREHRAVLTLDQGDFFDLHLLVLEAQGHHTGILVVRQDADPRKRMSVRDIVRAVAKVAAADIPIADEYTILNAWQ